MSHIRRVFSLIVLFGLLSNCLLAELFGQQQNEIQKFASGWATQTNQRLKSGILLRDIEPVNIRQEKNNKPKLYLANYDPSGFLLFFYQNNKAEIIGFSFENNFPKNPDHPLITDWISGISPGENISGLKSTKGVSLMQDAMVEPLIDAKWGQGSPWNKFCPADSNDRHALVGCVAVAMGQIMKRWNWPEKGTGANSYKPTNHPEYGTVEANFDTTHYNWDAMDNTAPGDASALLLFHAGVSTFMNYGPNESGANTSVYTIQAFTDNFSYYKGMQMREKERFSEKDWFIMLRQELINGRPVLYRGSNPDGGAGHAFNIDGFHSEHYFHFNWGWNGAGNGYFRLENMADGGDNFTRGQAAIFGIQPSNIPMHDRPASAQALPGDGFVELIWEGLVINDLSHYNIYRNDELIGNTWENHYRDTDLENGTQYVYHITTSYVGESPGESVATDDLEVTPWPRIELPYSLNLEEEPAGWELKQANDGFQWGTAADLHIPGNNGHLVTIRSDLAGPGTQVRDYFTSPTLDIRGLAYVAISFDYVFKQKPGVDYLFLMYRRYNNGLWYPVAKLDSTGSWADWRTAYFYLPDGAKNGPVQLGFYYNDFNGQGYGAAVDNIHLWQIDEPPVPAFSASETEICEKNTLLFSSQSTGEINDWHWDFGGGAEPRYAYDEGPHNVTYNSPGPKTVSLVLNHLDHLDKTDLLYITAAPIAGFEVSTSGLLASFTDSSKNGTYYWWDFGDGNTSTEKDPENKYHNFNEFTVTQVVYNNICEPDTSKIILNFRINSAVETNNYFSDLSLYPNPVGDYLWVKWGNANFESLRVAIFSVQGKLLIQERCSSNMQVIDFKGLPAGVYLLKISGSRAVKHYRIVKK